ncbi:MotA/TolQ/ExbB proton channel family protein [Caldimonas brevitalea]|uniref:Flagellar motor protein MotA n=1 Tax=Caldimonas brevitalea TaxID=413882 RepID=A0A0G3BKS0_9BURK|nr:MotA/TolQ/ExbB proton channel family protein [Caldimonas brevitalea]AKJ27956.1 flagellar motor protein MotA [Caldimonas brevitalea]
MINDIIQYSRDSWGLLPLLVIIFIIGVSVIIERYFFFARSIRSGLSLEYDLRRVAKGNVDDAHKVAQHYDATVQGELVKAAIEHKGAPEAVFERDVEETIMFQLPKLDRNLWLLDTCVTLGPLLGLLGTIVHLVEAFAVLAQSGGQNVSSVTGPIAHALVATAVGLVVAIVCVVFLNYFNKRIRLLINQMDLIKSMLVTRFSVISV